MVLMTSSATSGVFISFTRRSRSVGVTIPTRDEPSMTGSLWILFSLKILAASSTGVSDVMVMQFLFMIRDSWSSSKLRNMSFLDTIPTRLPSCARTTGRPVRPFLTMRFIASLRDPGTSATMGAGVIMSATVFPFKSVPRLVRPDHKDRA